MSKSPTTSGVTGARRLCGCRLDRDLTEEEN